MTWKAVANKYRAVRKKFETIKRGSTLENILNMKLNHIETQELLKLKQEHKKLIRDFQICRKCQEIVLNDCIDNCIEIIENDPMAAWDKSMSWGNYNPSIKTF